MLLLALALITAASTDDEVTKWAADKVRAHKAALSARPVAVDGGSALFRERAPLLPRFDPPSSLAPLVKAVRPGVVNLSTSNGGSARSLGSGFIISPDGLVVTNNHVIERAQSIRVRLADGRELDAALVGRDPSTDLALLRLQGSGAVALPTVYLGDSDLLEVGDWVVAIGNPFGLDTSVTHGIISARERVIGVGPFDDFIQTNALINPGNSGGPMFNMRGEVVGVCTAIVTQAQGIGFALPINLVKDLLPNLLENGRAERGWLGVNIQEVDDATGKAAVVIDAFKDSPAAKAGLQSGDRVMAVGGKQVVSYLQLLRRIALLAPGTTVKITVKREGRLIDTQATLVERPSVDALKAMVGAGRIDALGMVVRELTPEAARQLGSELGLLVAAVIPGGPSEMAGLQSGDVILEVQKQRVMDLKALKAALDAGTEPTVLVKYRRGESSQYVVIRRG
ncbi:MAG: trypsin-like peptidase domain-containing protein [Archangiaceae bacterium]|nr:trypsin-like peptidase domain-containing protein [Archangiaceae bacterium]